MPQIPGEPLVLFQASSVKELEIYCLVSIGDHGFEIQANPLRKLEGACWKREIPRTQPDLWKFPWPGLEPATHVILTRQLKCLTLPTGRIIWVYRCNHPARLFQDAWIPILHDQNLACRFLKENIPVETPRPIYDTYYPIVQTRAAPVPTPQPQPVTVAASIPAHVFRIFVESAVRTNTACPITLEPLTLESAAGLPCGHLFDKESLKEALTSNGSCPQCRRRSSIQEIQSL